MRLHTPARSSIAASVGCVALISGVAEAATVFVKQSATGGLNDGTSWANAYTDLQSALNQQGLGEGDEVWVAAGEYKPGASRSHSFELIDDVGVFGGFAGTETDFGDRNPVTNVTILSGDLSGNDAANFGNYGDNSYHVVAADSSVTRPDTPTDIKRRVNLDGFVITGGAATGTGTNEDIGGGTFINAGQPVIRDCTLTANLAIQGGGIMCLDTTTAPVIRNCRLISNKAMLNGHGGKGGGLEGNHSVTVINSVFYKNHADDWGGGFSIDAVVAEEIHVTLDNCKFVDNSCAVYGGGIYWDSEGAEATLTVNNCLLNANRALATTIATGGGMWTGGGSELSIAITNCTIVNNFSQGVAGGVAFYPLNYPVTITNCIFYGNDGALGVDDIDFVAVTDSVVYSAVAGYTTNNNIDLSSQSPLFGDPVGIDNVAGTLDDNFRLQSTSDCRNAGLNLAAPADGDDADEDSNTAEKLDLDRLTRILNTDVDMGCYEQHSSSTCCADINGTGCINIDDLLIVIADWGAPGLADIAAAPNCAGDGTVNINDLLDIIGNWGDCEGGPCTGSQEESIPQSVDDCMDDASELYEAFTPEWTAHVNSCCSALCRLNTIECD